MDLTSVMSSVLEGAFDVNTGEWQVTERTSSRQPGVPARYAVNIDLSAMSCRCVLQLQPDGLLIVTRGAGTCALWIWPLQKLR
jgi:hypothetical protein